MTLGVRMGSFVTVGVVMGSFRAWRLSGPHPSFVEGSPDDLP